MITVGHLIRCDGKRCREVWIRDGNLFAVLKRMEDAGWLHKDNKDFCPKCAAKLKESEAGK